MDLYFYEVEIIRVIDGDTVKCNIDLGFDTFSRRNVRISGIDTPELNAKDPALKAKANLAKNRVKELLPVGSKHYLYSKSYDKYGRVLGEILVDKVESLGDILLREKLAIEYKK